MVYKKRLIGSSRSLSTDAQGDSYVSSPSALSTVLITLLGFGYNNRFVLTTFSPSTLTLNSPKPPLCDSTCTFARCFSFASKLEAIARLIGQIGQYFIATFFMIDNPPIPVFQCYHQ